MLSTAEWRGKGWLALPNTGGYAVRPAQPVLRPPPTPTRPATPLPGATGYKRHAPETLPQVTGPGKASPVPAATSRGHVRPAGRTKDQG